VKWGMTYEAEVLEATAFEEGRPFFRLTQAGLPDFHEHVNLSSTRSTIRIVLLGAALNLPNA